MSTEDVAEELGKSGTIDTGSILLYCCLAVNNCWFLVST